MRQKTLVQKKCFILVFGNVLMQLAAFPGVVIYLFEYKKEESSAPEFLILPSQALLINK